MGTPGRDRATDLPATTLHLSHNELETLPAEIRQLPHLHRLELGRNKLGCHLAGLCQLLGQLSRLYRLDLSGNGLQTLPAEIRQLPRLQHLELSRNRLKAFPAELSQLVSMQELKLDHNFLSGSIPVELGQLVNLQMLGFIL